MSMCARWGLIMNASFNKRISISSCWAASRIALLDSVERYEDSYAISQEFCEWITCLDQNDQYLEASVLSVPSFDENDLRMTKKGTDEPLEI